MRRLFFLILILLGLYVAYPYWTLYRLQDALLTNNAESLKKIVDFPAVQASLKAQAEGGLMDKSKQIGEKHPVLGDIGAALTQALGSTVIGGTVDSLVTPEAILNNPVVVEHREKNEGFGENVTWAFFSSPTTFSIDAKTSDKPDAATVTTKMTLEGIRWRITDIELPPLGDLVKGAN